MNHSMKMIITTLLLSQMISASIACKDISDKTACKDDTTCAWTGKECMDQSSLDKLDKLESLADLKTKKDNSESTDEVADTSIDCSDISDEKACKDDTTCTWKGRKCMDQSSFERLETLGDLATGVKNNSSEDTVSDTTV